MKKNYLNFKKAVCGLAFALVFGHANYNAQVVTYSFTSCGITGPNGPSQANANTAYLATNLNGSVQVTAGIQQFTITQGGIYRIVAAGASGGGTNSGFGSRGRVVQADVNLTAGTVLKIMVGQQGQKVNGSSGGGGGSFIATLANVPLVVAGGGGGHLNPLTSAIGSSDGSFSNAGQNAACASGNGGAGGAGGTGSNNGWGGGGGGFNSNGTAAVNCANTGGSAFVNGGVGGGTCNNTMGGFGGGGGTHGNTGGGGGGGGYSGGGGSNQNIGNNAGGGGGSFTQAGATNVADLGLSFGDGFVNITKMCNISVSASLPSFCIGTASTTLSTDAISGYVWTVGATTVGVTQSITVSPAVTTTYVCSATSSANCVASSAIVVTVHPLPTINTAVSPALLCVGSTATMSAAGAVSYTWSSGGALNSAVNTDGPSVTKTYTVTGVSSNGCINTQVATVVVNTITLPAIAPSAICAGKQATITASGAASYTWSNGSPYATIFVSPATNTVYTVNGVDINNCPQSTTASVTVNALPGITGSASKSTICKGESVTLSASGAATYVWSNGIGSGSPLTITPALDITYNYVVTGTDASNCTNTFVVQVQVSKCTGLVDGKTSGTAVEVYPNPTNGVFHVKVSTVSANTSVNVYNALGKLVKSQIVSTDNITVDMQNEASGIYFVNINENNKTVYTTKIVKQ